MYDDFRRLPFFSGWYLDEWFQQALRKSVESKEEWTDFQQEFIWLGQREGRDNRLRTTFFDAGISEIIALLRDRIPRQAIHHRPPFRESTACTLTWCPSYRR